MTADQKSRDCKLKQTFPPISCFTAGIFLIIKRKVTNAVIMTGKQVQGDLKEVSRTFLFLTPMAEVCFYSIASIILKIVLKEERN